MIALLISGLTTATLSVLGSLLTKTIFEAVIRRMLIAVLKRIVASTHNTVDDDIIKPILKKLEN